MNDEEKKKIGATWLKKNSLDYWRHERMRKCIIPFVRENPNASWLTVGDGRYGTDANYLESLGAKSVHASDISDTLLRLGGKSGFISEYSAQNAESLAFPDNHFDYVYCKEAFHHFPRPFIALHEMFRVARKAVIFTEPRDAVIHLSLLKFMARKILRRSFGTHSFETVGNYVYLISERECEKFLLGMHYTHIAFTGCNDAYVSGVEFVPLSGGNWKQKRLRLFIRSLIVVMDALESIGVRHSSILTSALFKQEPSKALVSRLESAGWKVKNLPVNPYLNSEK